MVNIRELNIRNGLNFIVVNWQSLQVFNLIFNVNVFKCVQVNDVRVRNNDQSLSVDCDSVEFVLSAH